MAVFRMVDRLCAEKKLVIRLEAYGFLYQLVRIFSFCLMSVRLRKLIELSFSYSMVNFIVFVCLFIVLSVFSMSSLCITKIESST